MIANQRHAAVEYDGQYQRRGRFNRGITPSHHVRAPRPPHSAMSAFNVYLNGKKVCTAGINGNGVLGAHVSSVLREGASQEISLHVGGLRSATGDHVVWHEALALKAGDEVRIEIADAACPDLPAISKKPDPVSDERHREDYVRQIAKQLGWEIVVPKTDSGT